MKTSDSFSEIEKGLPQTEFTNLQFVRGIQILARMVTLLFLAALVWAVYQATVHGNPLPAWAWIGLVTLFAVATGLVVAVVVYRGVSKQVGPFDYSTANRATGEIQLEVRRVEVNGARSLRAELYMTAGVLQVSGARMKAPVVDPAVMDAAFTYDDADWKQPQVAYHVEEGGQGRLLVEQKGTGRPAMRPGRCEWAIRLNGDLPTELSVKFGAGNADLRLGGLSLNRLRVESGVGELSLDLSGEWKRSLEAFIKLGIGDTRLRLPQDVGVRVRSTVGLGSIQPHGLARDGEAYSNALYGQTAVNLDITIEGGIGKIEFQE